MLAYISQLSTKNGWALSLTVIFYTKSWPKFLQGDTHG